jgi:hypothetical protein
MELSGSVNASPPSLAKPEAKVWSPATVPLYPFAFAARKCPREGMKVSELIVNLVLIVPPLLDVRTFQPEMSTATSLLL